MPRHRCRVLQGLFSVTKKTNSLLQRLIYSRTKSTAGSRTHVSHLHILKVDELLRVCDHVWDGSPDRKVSIAFVENKLLHSSQHYPERDSLADMTKQRPRSQWLLGQKWYVCLYFSGIYLWCDDVTLLTIEEVFNHIRNLQKREGSIAWQ